METFLKSLNVQVGAYRAATTRTMRDWRGVENDFKEIQAKTRPLLRTWDMPQRDQSGRREARVSARRPETVRRRTVERETHTERPQSAFQVTHFEREKTTASRARAEQIRVGKEYPSRLDRRRAIQTR